MSQAVVLSIMLLILSCGTKPPEELIIGSWEARMGNETVIVEFRSDGTAQATEEEPQRWTLEKGDPPILRIYDIDDGSLEAELEVVFDGNDKVTLDDLEGMRVTMERTE